jgi:hypothetical protein
MDDDRNIPARSGLQVRWQPRHRVVGMVECEAHEGRVRVRMRRLDDVGRGVRIRGDRLHAGPGRCHACRRDKKIRILTSHHARGIPR